jgi:hypothetical protein
MSPPWSSRYRWAATRTSFAIASTGTDSASTVAWLADLYRANLAPWVVAVDGSVLEF